MTWTFTIFYDVGLTCQNVPGHWATKGKAAKAARNAGFRAWLDAGSPKTRQRCRVSAIVRRRRLLDPLNLPGACKNVFDGVLVGRLLPGTRMLVPALLPDDSAEWCEAGPITQELLPKGEGEPVVVLTVEELP